MKNNVWEHYGFLSGDEVWYYPPIWYDKRKKQVPITPKQIKYNIKKHKNGNPNRYGWKDYDNPEILWTLPTKSGYHINPYNKSEIYLVQTNGYVYKMIKEKKEKYYYQGILKSPDEIVETILSGLKVKLPNLFLIQAKSNFMCFRLNNRQSYLVNQHPNSVISNWYDNHYIASVAIVKALLNYIKEND